MINLELALGNVHAAAAATTELLAMQQLALSSCLLPTTFAAGSAAPPLPPYQSLLAHETSLPCINMQTTSHQSNVTSSSSNILLDQLLCSPLPPGWEQCLNLQSGDVFYKNLSTGSTTHMDPRALISERNGDTYRHFGASQCGTTLIQTNIVEAASANQVYERHRLEFALGTTNQEENPHFQEKLSGDVDLDLRLSSFLHVKENTSSQSPLTLSHDSSMLAKSCSSLSCISDATMPRPPSNKVMHDIIMRADNDELRPQYRSSSCSSSSSPSATLSYQRQSYDNSDQDDLMNGEFDISRFDANHDDYAESMKMVTAACSRCLMFVLLSSTKEPMRCPLCGSHANPL